MNVHEEENRRLRAALRDAIEERQALEEALSMALDRVTSFEPDEMEPEERAEFVEDVASIRELLRKKRKTLRDALGEEESDGPADGH